MNAEFLFFQAVKFLLIVRFMGIKYTGMVLFARTFCTHVVFFTTLHWLNLQTKQFLFAIYYSGFGHFPLCI